MKVVLIFVDGLGIGSDNPAKNPCVQSDLKYLGIYDHREQPISTNGVISLGLNATLGIQGLPQSATGQTTLLTGVNASKKLGRHLQGFPNQTLCKLLTQQALPKKIKAMGLLPVFVNAYRSEFFILPEQLKWRLSVTTVANLAAELPFKTIDDLKAKQALYHDITNEHLIRKGLTLPEFSPEQAGEILANICKNYDFILYEYFMTDKAGHSQQITLSRVEIQKLDRFFYSLLDHLNPEQTTVILTSDHGNIEDLSVKTHTMNPAMTLVWGQSAEKISKSLKTIQNISPSILHHLRDIHA